MNTILTNQSYSQENSQEYQKYMNEDNSNLPSSLISLGENQSDFALIVDKNNYKLSVFKTNEKGTYDLVKTYEAAIGKKNGNKTFAGDKRTPEGIYFITEKMTGKNLPSKYGSGALALDYPNIFDQKEHKTGHGIWIHGVDNDNRINKQNDTDGCIALKNNDLLDLNKFISLQDTPVIITKEIQFSTSQNILLEKKSEILDLIYSWKDSWETSSIDEYKNYYSESFKADNKNKKQWILSKTNLSSKQNGKISIEISNPKILVFEDQLIVSFLQKYTSPSKVDLGKKFLYLKNEEGSFKIISEKWIEEKKSNNFLNVFIKRENHEYAKK